MLSKRTQYAMRAVLYLAINSKKSFKIGVNVIAEKLDVPKQFLSKILQELVKKNLVKSSKGKLGGFYLSPANKKNSLRQIVEVFDGDSLFCNCVMGLPSCSSDNPCPLHESASAFRIDLERTLEDRSISEVADKISTDGLRI